MMLPLLNTMRGLEEKGNGQDGIWEETLPYCNSHRVTPRASVTPFVFASGQLSGELIIVFVCVCVCSSEDTLQAA